MLHALNAAFRGSRAYTDADVKARETGQTFNGLPDGLTRFRLIELVKDNRDWLGLNRSQTDLLVFLILKTWDQDWEPGQKPITWLSVKAMAKEIGVCRRQARNVENALGDAQLLTWNDSANHARWGKRDEYGYIIEAYGADLSPLGAMASELLEADRRRKAEELEQERTWRSASALRRTVRAMLARAVKEGLIDLEDEAWSEKTVIVKEAVRSDTPLAALRELTARPQLLSGELETLIERSESREENSGRDVKTSPQGEQNFLPYKLQTKKQTDKSVTSTQRWGQSTACGGEADAPCGANSSIKMVDGRENEGFRAIGSEMEAAREDRCAAGSRREPQNEVPPANFEADAQNLMRIEARTEGKGQKNRELATGAASEHNDGNRYSVESPKPKAGHGQRSRIGGARGDGSNHSGAPANDPGLPPGRSEQGGLWKPDTGTRHLSPLNVVETAGPRLLAAVSQANRTAETDQPDWAEIEDAAENLCPQLGIGPQVWWVAVTVMGRRSAAICVMLIDRKMCPDAEEPVRRPGAYLRGMTDRARKDELHLHASIFGWVRGKAV